jgi:hypothetical protein
MKWPLKAELVSHLKSREQEVQALTPRQWVGLANPLASQWQRKTPLIWDVSKGHCWWMRALPAMCHMSYSSL